MKETPAAHQALKVRKPWTWRAVQGNAQKPKLISPIARWAKSPRPRVAQRARLAEHEARAEARGGRQQAPEVALHGQLVALREHHHHAPAVVAPGQARLR